MRLIDLDAIMVQFPDADFDGDVIENMKAYPYWKIGIDGLINVLKAVPIIEQSEDCISREEAIRIAEQGQIQGYEWQFKELCNLSSVTPSYNSIKPELKPCEDAISRDKVIMLIDEATEKYPYKVIGLSDTYSNYNQGWADACDWLYANIESDNLPSVTPKYTDDEIQKMQELEQAQLEKAYELGKVEMQPCEDCISKEEVLDVINFEDEWLFDANSHNADTKIAFSTIKSKISEMPSVTPKAKWIPVSERLPEEHICDDGFHEPSKSVLVQMKSGAMHTARYWSRYDERWLDLNYPTTDGVIAWMPLPQPYKAERSDSSDKTTE